MSLVLRFYMNKNQVIISMNNQVVAFIPTHMLHHKFCFTIYIIPVYYFVAFWVDLIRGINCHNNQQREATSTEK